MPTDLTYPYIGEGYKWNLLYKIYLKTGYWCDHVGQKPVSSILKFDEDLTPQEKTDVNTIVGDGSTCQDPIKFATANNKFIIKDVYWWRNQIETAVGFNVAVSYQKSGSHPEEDEIVLQPTDPTYQMEKILTQNQKNQLRSALEDLIRLE
jgi:hypothetical protein